MSSATIARTPLPRVPLKDTVLAMLSIAAEQGRTTIPLRAFYRASAVVANEYSDIVPPLIFTRTEHSAYSKRLDEALSERIGYSVDLPNPRLQRTALRPSAAKRHLAWLSHKYGSEYLERVQQLTSAFLRQV